MVGPALRSARTSRNLTQEALASSYHISDSLIREIEKGRRKLPKDIKPKMARELDDPALYLTLAREATGGIGAPYLNRIDDHRLCCVVKFKEEFLEALECLDRMTPALVRASSREQLTKGELADLKVTLTEIIECVTAAQNTVARLAKTYGENIAALWDEHQAKLVASGYLEIEKNNCPGR